MNDRRISSLESSLFLFLGFVVLVSFVIGFGVKLYPVLGFWSIAGAASIVAFLFAGGIILVFGDDIGEHLAKNRVKLFLDSYDPDAGKSVEDAEKIFRRNYIQRDKLEGKHLVWPVQNLSANKLKGVFAVTVNDVFKDGLHKHDRLKFVGVNFFWATYWFAVSPGCEGLTAVRVVQDREHQSYGFWVDLKKHASPAGRNSLLAKFVPVPNVTWEGFVGPVRKDSIEGSFVSLDQRIALLSVKENLPESMTWGDVHNFFYHPEVFGVGTELEGVPMSYIKKMLDIPETCML